MTGHRIDVEKLRVALRRMDRDRLLKIADRAIEIVPASKLRLLVGDLVDLEPVADSGRSPASLLVEVRKFEAASLRREYYDSFDVNSKNYMDTSEGTEVFMAEFERLLGKCVRAAAKKPRVMAREAFDVLFGLLRRIDKDPDSIIFFADEGGAWQVHADWGEALPAYFRCLADEKPGEEFARVVDGVIRDFADWERPRHLTAALGVANAEQRIALRRIRKGASLGASSTAKNATRMRSAASKTNLPVARRRRS